MEFYCVKCRKKVSANPTETKKVKGKNVVMHKGKCRCGTNLTRFGKA